MPWRDRTALPPITATVIQILESHRRSSGDLRNWYDSLLDRACRELEDFVTPDVSIRADDLARSMGLGDIRRFHWDDQPSKMKDRGRKLFHWDHYVPVSELKGNLIALDHPIALQAVETILTKAAIVWILKDENDKLNSLGLSHKRPDAKAAYVAAGIVLVEHGAET